MNRQCKDARTYEQIVMMNFQSSFFKPCENVRKREVFVSIPEYQVF